MNLDASWVFDLLRAKNIFFIILQQKAFSNLINNFLCVRMGCEESQIKDDGSANLINGDDSNLKARKRNKRQKINGRVSVDAIFQNIKKVECTKSEEDIKFIEQIIGSHFLLYKLGASERRQLAIAMQAYETDQNGYVFEQGTPASMFFIINKGVVQIEINGARVKEMKRGDYFGQLALIYAASRSASVKAVESCKFWCLSQIHFKEIQRQMVKNNFRIAKPHVQKLPLFNFLTNKQKSAIAYNMHSLKYEKDEIIFKLGDDATSFYVIIEGMIEIQIPGKPLLYLKVGESFGENCMKKNQIRGGTAKCSQKSQLLAIGAEDLRTCLGSKSQEELIFHNIIKWAIKRSTLFKNFSTIEQKRMIDLGKICLFKHNERIIKEGVADSVVYICLQGKVNNYQVGDIINEGKYDVEVFKEEFINEESLIKINDGHVFSLSFKNIKLLKEKEKYLMSKRDKILNKSNSDSKKEPNGLCRKLSSEKIDLADLHLLRKLGEGQFGKVYLVENKKNNHKYALKCIEKNTIIQNKMEKFIQNEKEILEKIDFPLIVKFVTSSHDSHFIYLLLNFIDGGDFFDVLRDIGLLTNQAGRFYIACLILCVEYLHGFNIVYRDLKPENAAVDAAGYLYMIDLGTAKELKESDAGLRTFTIIGTPHYMAPQVYEGKGYSLEVDIWALGVILYEMLCSKLPFGNDLDDPMLIFKDIQENELRFPKWYSDFNGRELVKRLMMKRPQNRSVDDFEEIKQMAFFSNFDWKGCESKQLETPYKPKQDLKSDKTYKNQLLANYLQREKEKMKRPFNPRLPNWDDCF